MSSFSLSLLPPMRLIIILPALLILFGISGCKKSGGGGGGGGGGGETPLAVTLNPPAGSVQPASPLVDFPLTVTVTSTMPSAGVEIAVSAKVDGSADPPFFQATQNTSAATTNFTITNTPLNVVCLVTVTVTSRSQSTNKWTGTYRYSRK